MILLLLCLFGPKPHYEASFVSKTSNFASDMKPIQGLNSENASIEQDANPQPSDHRTSALPLSEDNCSNQYSLHDLESLYFASQKNLIKILKADLPFFESPSQNQSQRNIDFVQFILCFMFESLF